MTTQTELPEQELPLDDQPDDIAYEPQWGQWTRQFTTVLLVIASIYALTLLGPIIQILVASFLIAFLLYIPCRFVANRTPLNFSGSVAVVYLVLIFVIILLLLSFVPGLIASGRELSDNIQDGYTEARQWLRDYTRDQGVITVFNFSVDLNPYIEQIRQLLGEVEAEASADLPTEATDFSELFPSTSFNPAAIINFLTNVISSIIGGVTGFISTMFLALFISFLILIELPSYQRQFLRSVPRPHRREVFIMIDKMRRVWSGFFQGQVTLVFIIGVLTWVQLTVMGVDSALALAVLVAFVSLIPTIGGIIALIPLAIVPFVGGSSVFVEMPNPTFAVLVVVVNLMISQLIWNVVAPKILGDAISLPIPVIILGVFIGAALGGAAGAFLIVPILGTLRILVMYLISKINQRDPFPGEDVPDVTFLARL